MENDPPFLLAICISVPKFSVSLQVNQPDTSSALRVQSLVQYALKRHPKMTMPNGLEVTRQIEIVVPRKPIQAWSARQDSRKNPSV